MASEGVKISFVCVPEGFLMVRNEREKMSYINLVTREEGTTVFRELFDEVKI